jgi:hypothetical protein
MVNPTSDTQGGKDPAGFGGLKMGVMFFTLATVFFMTSFLLSWSCMSDKEEAICFGSGIGFLVCVALGIRSFIVQEKK